jgi:hypothetical protein
MKKKLLKPPEHDSEILLLPGFSELNSRIDQSSTVATAHQPYFFNPGVSLKFLLLESLSAKNKRLFFLDTDQISLYVNIPLKERGVRRHDFIMTDEVLYSWPRPQEKSLRDYFLQLGNEIGNNFPDARKTSESLKAFADIILSKRSRYLKDILAESFLEFYGIGSDYQFVSELFKTKEFYRFFETIHSHDAAFRKIFNTALDDYREEFRFRFKNFPFPRLSEGELPFWVVKENKRFRCFKKDIELSDFDKTLIFPRAQALTMFLRLYHCDVFIHGTGGGNYEWVGDKVIERFFDTAPRPYAVASGTFLIEGTDVRDIPYFLFSPQRVKEKLNNAVLGGVYG